MFKKILYIISIFLLFLCVGCGQSKVETITIIYNTNGGNVIENEVIDKDKISNFVLPVDPIKEGYVFKGWFTDPDCTIPFKEITNDVNGEFNLYVKWLNEDDPSLIPAPKFLKMEVVENKAQKVEDNNKKKYNKMKAHNNFITLADGLEYDYESAIDDTISVLIILESNGYDSVVDVVIDDSQYGDNCIYLTSSTKYKIVRQDIEFNEEFNGYVTEVELLLPKSIVAGNRKIKIKKIELLRQIVSTDKFQAQIDPSDDIDLDFNIIDTFNINFNVLGNVVADKAKTLKYLQNINIDYIPEREGYTFDGWYLDNEFTQKFELDKMPNHDLMLYAKFKINKISITFINQFNKAIIKKIDWGTSLTDIPELKYDKNVIYVWNRTNFENLTDNITVKAVKYAEINLTEENTTIVIDFYKDNNLCNYNPRYEVYSNNQLVEATIENNIISNLDSNKEYIIKCFLGDKVLEKEIKLKKEKPSVDITLSNIEPNKVDFNLKFNDKDLTGNVSKISIYKNNQLVETLADINNRTFNNLVSNTNYTIKAEYLYDLDDGLGIFKETKEFSVHTPKYTPTFKIFEERQEFDEIYICYEIIDSDAAIKSQKISIVDLLNNKIIETKNGLNAATFNNLLANHGYNIKYEVEYDLNDGTGTRFYNDVKLYYTKGYPAVEPKIENIITTERKVNFEINIYDPYNLAQLKKIELYDNSNVVQTIENTNNYEFDNLLSNHEYLIIATYEIDYKDGNGLYTYKADCRFNTNSYGIPSLSIVDSISSYNYITGKIQLNGYKDSDITTIKQVELLLDGNVINVYKDLDNVNNSFRFNELKDNTSYTVKVIYEYDLNEGNGPTSGSFETEIKTLEYVFPTISFSSIGNVYVDNKLCFNKIQIDFSELDSENIGKPKEIQLLKDDLVMNTITNIPDNAQNEHFIIENTLSNTNYVAKLIYEYEFNDGKGKQIKEYTINIKTEELADPQIAFAGISADYTYINYRVNYTDEFNLIKSSKVELFKGDELINTVDISNTTFDNLLSNTDYAVKLTYSLDKNDGLGSITKTLEFTEHTQSYELPILTLKIQEMDLELERSLFYQLYIIDHDNIGKFKEVQLIKDNVIIQTITDINKNKFSNLLTNTKYQIKAIYEYDLNEGKGIETLEVVKEHVTAARNLPQIDLEVSNINFDYAEVKVIKELNYETLELKELILLNGETIVKTITDFTNGLVFNFDNLLSNTEYVIKVVYTYDLNDGTGIQTEEKLYNVKTLEKTVPTININGNDPTRNSISFSLNIVDPENVSIIKSIEVFEGETLVQSLEDLTLRKVENLLSNRSYDLVVTLAYDLNDGMGERLISDRLNFMTTDTFAPVIEFNNIICTQESVRFGIVISDIDQTGSLTKLAIYKDNLLVEETTSVNVREFTNLLANTTYELRATYTADLNYGNGMQDCEIPCQFTTLPDLSISKFELVTQGIILVGNKVTFRITLDNKYNQDIDSLDLNEKLIYVSKVSKNTYEFTIIAEETYIDNPLLTIDSLRVTSPKKGKIITKVNNTFNIKVYRKLNLIDVNFVDNNKTNVKYAFPSTEVYLTLNFDLSEYDLIRVVINGVDVKNELIKETANRYLYKLPLATGSNVFKIDTIEYGLNNEVYGSISLKKNFLMYKLISDEKRTISNSTELLNMEAGYYYELLNDIDLTTTDWILKDFDGVLNGNGHIISNLYYFVEEQFDSLDPASLHNAGLFGTATGVIEKTKLTGFRFEKAASVTRVNHGLFAAISDNLTISECEVEKFDMFTNQDSSNIGIFVGLNKTNLVLENVIAEMGNRISNLVGLSNGLAMVKNTYVASSNYSYDSYYGEIVRMGTGYFENCVVLLSPGQFSCRYGNIETIVNGHTVVWAEGRFPHEPIDTKDYYVNDLKWDSNIWDLDHLRKTYGDPRLKIFVR